MSSPIINFKESSGKYYFELALKDLKNEYGKFIFVEKFREAIMAKKNQSVNFAITDNNGKEVPFFDWINKASIDELQNAVWSSGLELTRIDMNSDDDFMTTIPKGLLTTEYGITIDKRYSIQERTYGISDNYKINKRLPDTELE